MSWLDRTIGFFSPEAEARRTRARVVTDRLRAVNGYDGAGKGRRNTWTRGSDSSANAESRAALPLLRARHRELVRNNPYAASAVRVLTTNIVSTGIRPRAVVEDAEQKKTVQRTMLNWCESTAVDYDGRHNLYGLQALAVRTAVECGDAIIVRVTDRDPALKVPLKLRLLEGDYLDHTKNGQMNGGYAVQGVQFNAQHQRVGYWLHRSHPGDALGGFSGSKLTPAADVIHLFEMLRPGQVRGVPRGTAAIMRMKNLDDYQDARIEAAKSAACLVGVVVETEGDTDRKGDVLPEKLEPGMFPRLKGGEDVRFNNPPSVSGHGEFVSVEQHAIAIAYGVPFAALTGNLERVNFSSGRMGHLEFTRNVEQYRWASLIPTVCQGVGEWFNQAAMLVGEIKQPVRWEWTPPRREMIDPSREIPPIVDMVRAGLGSLSEQIRSMGFEPEDVFAEIKQERDSLNRDGIIVTTDAGRVSDAGVTQARAPGAAYPEPGDE